MPDTAHDPPSDLPRDPPGASSRALPQPDLDALRRPGFEKYTLIKDRLRREPITLIHEMMSGGYRYKSRRGKPGVLVLRRGQHGMEPVPELMPIRQVALELTRITDVAISYETVRRWWDVAWAHAGGDPGLLPDAVPPPGTTQVGRQRMTRRRGVTPGDAHVQENRKATNRAKARATNQDVPAAAFLPPTD